MEYLVPLAAKSLLIAGGTLLLLKLMHRRSSSDRSWVAHLGLLALLLLPVGSVTLPALNVVGPDFLATEAATALPATASSAQADAVAAPEVASTEQPFQAPAVDTDAAPRDWLLWAYAAPAVLLILLTLIALGRLSLLKARASVMTDTHWLRALAQAQKRMSFKNGTALLTSDELRSPISWGLMRPVILLNTDATKAKAEAEAIIAHELAHVAGLDWAKLMVSRVTVAIFWFNPLVWLLAREAHQLREEAADDAVLAANIEETEYAHLLVGIARHECRGLLLGAHGVAPGKGSLSRRVKRVLDAALERAPGGWKWSSAAAFFAAGMTVPLAALQFVAPTIAEAAEQGRFVPDQAVPPQAVAAGAAIAAGPGPVAQTAGPAAAASPASPAESRVIVDISSATHAALAAAGQAVADADGAIEKAIELKAAGVTPAYVRAVRAAAPHLRLTHDDLIELSATGVTPGYIGDLARSGYRGLSAEQIIEAKALNIDGAYIRGMAATGYGHLSIDDLGELRAVGVAPGDVARYRRANEGLPSVEALINAKAVGLTPEDIAPGDNDP